MSRYRNHSGPAQDQGGPIQMDVSVTGCYIAIRGTRELCVPWDPHYQRHIHIIRVRQAASHSLGQQQQPLGFPSVIKLLLLVVVGAAAFLTFPLTGAGGGGW